MQEIEDNYYHRAYDIEKLNKIPNPKIDFLEKVPDNMPALPAASPASSRGGKQDISGLLTSAPTFEGLKGEASIRRDFPVLPDSGPSPPTNVPPEVASDPPCPDCNKRGQWTNIDRKIKWTGGHGA